MIGLGVFLIIMWLGYEFAYRLGNFIISHILIVTFIAGVFVLVIFACWGESLIDKCPIAGTERYGQIVTQTGCY